MDRNGERGEGREGGDESRHLSRVEQSTRILPKYTKLGYTLYNPINHIMHIVITLVYLNVSYYLTVSLGNYIIYKKYVSCDR